MLHLGIRTKNKQYFILTGLLLGFAIWTKNDGFAYSFSFIIISATILWLRSDNNILCSNYKYLIIWFSIILLFVLHFKHSNSISNDLIANIHNINLHNNFFNFDNYLIIFKYYLYETKLYLILFLILFLIKTYCIKVLNLEQDFTIDHVVVIGILSVFLTLLIYKFIYLITPYDLEWHLEYSIKRLIIHISPLMIYLLFLSIPHRKLS
mgnify:CR=1 FL=1